MEAHGLLAHAVAFLRQAGAASCAAVACPMGWTAAAVVEQVVDEARTFSRSFLEEAESGACRRVSFFRAGVVAATADATERSSAFVAVCARHTPAPKAGRLRRGGRV